MPSEAQIRRLYAIASEKGWTRNGVKRMLEINYGIRSTKELTSQQYDEVCAFLEKSLAADVTTMGRDKNTIDMFDQQKEPL